MSDSLTLELPPVPDRDSACNQAPLLLAAATEAGDIILDGEQVERLSTVWVQIIAATALEARRTGASFMIQRPSQAFTAAFQDLGLDLAELGLPEPQSSDLGPTLE
jgi:anti-anti-sigma regulatory factor